MGNLIYLVLLLALGKLSNRLKAFPENTADVLNQFVIYFSFPATVLIKINGLEVKPELLVLAFIPWLMVGFAVFVVIGLAKVLQWEKQLTGAVMLSVALGNTSFFGFPAVTAFFGDEYLGYAIIYDQVGSFLALATFGTIVVSVFGSALPLNLKSICKKVVGFPPFIALVAGFVFINVQISGLLFSILNGISATLIPLDIFSVGSQLRFRQPLANIYPICITIALKMVATPFIVVIILMSMGVKGMVFNISVFEAAMPSMVMAGVLAASGKLRSDIANAAIGYGILLSFITLPVLYAILTRLSIP